MSGKSAGVPNRASRRSRGNTRRRAARRRGARGFLTSPTLFPARRVATMCYDALVALSPAATALAYNTFRLNSLFDPDFTGVGTTVSGYTTMSALYNRYRVVSVKIHIDATSNASLPSTVFLVANPLNTVGTSITAIMSQKYSWCKPLGNTNAPGVSHTCKISIADCYGTTRKAVWDEDDFAGLVGANPNNVAFLHIGVYNNSATAFGAAQAQILVRMTFTVEWSLPLMTT